MENWLPWTKKAASTNRRTIGFNDMKHAIEQGYVIVNTLPETLQGCLIKGSIAADEEEDRMNDYLQHDETDKIVVLYGMNSCDDSVDRKFEELADLGFRRIYIYVGGLFEWLMLQEIIGISEFPTTSRCMDLMVYQPIRRKF